MQSDVISLRLTFDPARVELSSTGTQRGVPFDIVEADGGRACMWAGMDLVVAMASAVDCAEGGLDVIDLTGAEPSTLLRGAIS